MTVEQKASLKVGKWITLLNVKRYQTLNNSGFWPINIEKTHNYEKNFDSFQVLHWKNHSRVALHSLFPHAQHDTSVCAGLTNLCSGKNTRYPFEFQRHCFYFQHCQYNTSASCLKKLQNIVTNELFLHLCGVSGHPVCQHNPVTKTSVRPVYLTN